MISTKTKSEIEMMRKAGQVVGQTIELLARNMKPGITSGELDQIAEDFIRSQDCIPAFKGLYDFPNSILTSFNEEVVHGIPGKRVLQEGDIVSFDVGAAYKGWNADSAATFPVGKVTEQAQKLINVTRKAMLLGISQMKLGNHLYDISNSINDYVESQGFSVVRDYVGHGIGRKVHEDPQVPNFRQPVRGMSLRKGMCLAVEPMVNVGSHETVMLEDGWTVVTKDGKLSCHFEHSAAITDGEPLILTLP
ncbi:MAG TPA: type I methionyl aminopeptidase [Chloroflexia bacterium]|nr:type I methionyl aminopeptidase [Chloroflexia bacterium]